MAIFNSYVKLPEGICRKLPNPRLGNTRSAAAETPGIPLGGDIGLQRRWQVESQEFWGWHQHFVSMDWFKGKFTGKLHISWEKSTVSCRFSLKPIHCLSSWWLKSIPVQHDEKNSWIVLAKFSLCRMERIEFTSSQFGIFFEQTSPSLKHHCLDRVSFFYWWSKIWANSPKMDGTSSKHVRNMYLLGSKTWPYP